MADNTIQYRWIVTIPRNLNALFKPDGRPILTFQKLNDAREQMEHEHNVALARAARLRALGIDPDTEEV